MANISKVKIDENIFDVKDNNAIENITRNGITFTATKRDGTTFTFNQQDNNTTYSAGTGTTITGANNAINVTYGSTANTACQGNDARLSDSRNAKDVYAWAKTSTKPTYTASEVGAIASTLKGANNGVAELDANGLVPSSQLPSFVDDVLEYSTKSSFPTSGETGKIYVDTSTNITYRWSGSAYVEISSSLALGETSSTAYRGDRGKIAYDHSQSTHARTDATKTEVSSTNGNIKINGTETTVYTHPGSGTNPHGTTKSDVGLGNVGNFKAVSTVASQGLTDTEKSNARANIGAVASSHTHNYAGSSSAGGAATTLAGTYSGNGGQLTPSVVTGGTVRVAMMNNPKGLTGFPTYADCILMDAYTGNDVPWTTGLGIVKQDASPRMFIFNGAKGNTTTWKNITEVVTAGNFTSQSLTKSQVTTALGYTPPTSDTNTNYYHTTGSWNGLTYTATANGGAGALAFTIPTGTTATTVSAGNHTHTTSIATSSSTNQLTMAFGTKYAITAGGTSYVFTMPANPNTDTKVTQTATSTDANYEVLFSATADNTTRTEGARKDANFKYNPSTNLLTVSSISSHTIEGSVYSNKNEVGFGVNSTDGNYSCMVMVGAGGVNRGLYDNTLNKWMVYADDSNVYLNGTAENATKWNSVVYDMSTVNTTDTWIPVLSYGKFQRTVRSIWSAKSHSNYNTNQDHLATISCLTWWNGAYNASGGSNLTYCNKGAFGTIVTKSAGEYVSTSTNSGSFYAISNFSKYSNSNNANVTANGTNYLIPLTTSDVNLKKNIENTEIEALSIINKLQHRKFSYKYEELGKDTIKIGYIAQELEEVIPESVIDIPQNEETSLGGLDNIKQIDYHAIIPYLTKAIQELSDIVKEQQKVIDKYSN